MRIYPVYCTICCSAGMLMYCRKTNSEIFEVKLIKHGTLSNSGKVLNIDSSAFRV